MRQRLPRSALRTAARWLVPLGIAVALALAWWRPWRVGPPATAPPVALVPTPTLPRMPTPTPSPARIALPVGTPIIPAPPPAPPAGPAAAGPRAPGMLLYLGTFAGKRGIVAAAADGGGRRLVAEGRYASVAWSPTGDRFAATGALDGAADQVAVFAADGRPLARHPFAGRVGRLLWSPDGGALACAVVPPGPDPPDQPAPAETWLIATGGHARRVDVPQTRHASPFAWTPDGQLYVVGVAAPAGRRALWLIGPGGTYPYRDADDLPAPLGFSADGARLFALGPAAAAPPLGPHARPPLTEVVAIDVRSDARRTVADADRLGAAAFGTPPRPGGYAIEDGLLAPDAEHLALVVARRPAPGTPSPAGAREAALVFVRVDGAITGVVGLPEGGGHGPFSWSPDGALLAYFAPGGPTGEHALRIVDTGGAPRGAHAIDRAPADGGPAIAWSPDGRWLAYTAPGGLTVAAPDGARAYPLATDGGAPAWRP